MPEIKTAPEGYNNGKLKLPKPQKPLKGRGYERYRWRMDGLLDLKDNADHFRNVEMGLQRWYLHLLGEEHHIMMDAAHWVTREALHAFLNHESIWRDEWQRSKIDQQSKKKSAAIARRASKKKKLKKQKIRIQSLAADAGLSPEELGAKCERFKSLIHSGKTTLAGQMIQVAEPWLLKSLLDGCSAMESDIILSPFFQDRSNSKSEFLFWFAAAKAVERQCCPRSIVLNEIAELELTAGNSIELEWILQHVMPKLENLRMLHLNLGSVVFSTADLPVMQQLIWLYVCGDEESENGVELKVEHLNRQPSLRGLSVGHLGSLFIMDYDASLWNRVRLETRCSEDRPFARRSNLKPVAELGSAWHGIRELNANGLQVFLHMQQDWSTSSQPPAWWRPYWSLPDVLSKVNGKIVDFDWPEGDIDTYSIHIKDRAGKIHRHEIPFGHKHTNGIGGRISKNEILAESPPRIIDLVGWENLPAELAKHLADSRVPIRLQACLLTPEVIKALAPFRGDLHVEGRLSLDQLESLSHISASKLELEFESFDRQTFPILSRLKASSLSIIINSKLTPGDVEHLCDFSGKSVLKGWPRGNSIHIDQSAAEVLCRREHKILLADSLHLTASAIGKLSLHPTLDLRGHRQTFLRHSKSGETSLTIIRYYDPTNRKPYTVRKTLQNTNGTKKTSEEQYYEPSCMLAVIGKLLESGYEPV